MHSCMFLWIERRGEPSRYCFGFCSMEQSVNNQFSDTDIETESYAFCMNKQYAAPSAHRNIPTPYVKYMTNKYTPSLQNIT